MIRTYTVRELEEISGLTRRTIGDYVSKGLLAGPSHRGRGARYAQADVDVLQLIPKLRTLLKDDFPNLTTLRDFLCQLSSRDLHSLASKTSESGFKFAVRFLHVRNGIAAMLPQVSPERIEEELQKLTPEQIRRIDAGRLQLGAVIDMQALLNGSEAGSSASEYYNGPAIDGGGAGNGNGFHALEGSDYEADSSPSWSVNWLDGYVQTGGSGALPPESSAVQAGHAPAQRADREPARGNREGFVGHGSGHPRQEGTEAERLSDISRRLERLERMLVSE